MSSYVLVFNNLSAAKEAQSAQQDQIVFSLNYKNTQWHLSLIGADETYPLELSEELAQKLATLEDNDVEKLTSINLKRIKRECIKARELYLAKIQISVNPEEAKAHTPLTNGALVQSGMTSTFVLRNVSETSLWWINSIGVANEISLDEYPKLTSWLALHKYSFNAGETLQFKAYLLQVKTTKSFSQEKLEDMNGMLSKVLHHTKSDEPVEEKTGKLDLGLFKQIEQHMEDRLKKIASRATPESTDNTSLKNTPKKFSPQRYAELADLHTFWQQRQVDVAVDYALNETVRNVAKISKP
ncbi:MAG: hypothetical protein ACRCXC_09595 [Legionella sp.]